MNAALGAVVAAIAMSGTALAEPATKLSPEIDAKVRERMVGLLRDPMSAEIMVTKGPWGDEVSVFGQTQRGQFYCALINAKNGYGAYIGYRPYMFIVRDDGRVGVWQKGTIPETDAIMASKCGAGPA